MDNNQVIIDNMRQCPLCANYAKLEHYYPTVIDSQSGGDPGVICPNCASHMNLRHFDFIYPSEVDISNYE